MSAWVVVLRGVDGSPEEIRDAATRARDALGLPCTGSVTVEEWLFDEATGNRLREERLAA